MKRSEAGNVSRQKMLFLDRRQTLVSVTFEAMHEFSFGRFFRQLSFRIDDKLFRKLPGQFNAAGGRSVWIIHLSAV